MKASVDHYWVDITSNTSGIFKIMSSEEAISGTRQNAARTVMDRLKYASRFSLKPLPIPNSKKQKKSEKPLEMNKEGAGKK